MAAADLILAGIDRLEGKVDRVQDTLSEQGERLSRLETTREQHEERLRKLEDCTHDIEQSLASVPERVRASLTDRIRPLEQRAERSKGMLWAAGIAWSLLVALPGLVAAAGLWIVKTSQ